MLARISSAVLVQTKGLGCSFVTSRYVEMARSKACVLAWAPRRTCFSVRSPNQRSTRFSHEALVGVKCAWNRGRLASHRRISAVLSLLLNVPGRTGTQARGGTRY